MQTVKVEILRLAHAPLELPEYASAGSAGMDLRLASGTITIQPGEGQLLPTGFCVAIPAGYEGQIRLRSGFASRSGLLMPNAPGTIDSDYRGEILVSLVNLTPRPVNVSGGERFAQLVISPVTRAEWQPVNELPASDRGSGGFGSTG